MSMHEWVKNCSSMAATSMAHRAMLDLVVNRDQPLVSAQILADLCGKGRSFWIDWGEKGRALWLASR